MNKIIIDDVKPEWLRQELIENVSKGNNVTLQIHYNGKLINEYPIIDIKIEEEHNKEEKNKKNIKESKKLFNSKYRFKIDSDDPKDKYPESKIKRFIDDLNLIWNRNYKNLGYYLKLFLPDVAIKRCGKKKDKYKFVTK